MERLQIDEASLASAGAGLVAAAKLMAEDSRRGLPRKLPGLTGIGDDVKLYLVSLHMAREALAEAARTAGRAVAELMQDSTALDHSIAQLAETRFVGRGSKR